MTKTAARAMTARCRITVSGPLGAAAVGAIHAQYDHVAVSSSRVDRETVIVLDGLDQPALRGVLTLLWDFGHDVVAVAHQPKEHPRRSASRRGQVRAVPVPVTGLLAGVLARVDWSDAYEVACPVDASTDPQVWADAIFHHAPHWVRGLLAVRQATVALVGIDRGRPNTFDTRTRTDREVLLGADERHLSFRASVFTGIDRVVLTTVVQVHNRRGRAYSALVRLFHPLIVRAVLARAARILHPTHQGVL